MKYKGKKLTGRNSDILVLPRGNDRIVFKAEAIDSYDEFNKLCPQPTIPTKMLPGGIKEPNAADPTYRTNLTIYGKKKLDFCILKSLAPTTDLEWERVDMQKPDTWHLYIDELKESNISENEISRIIDLCLRVNSLDDDMLKQAREDFLAEAPPQEA